MKLICASATRLSRIWCAVLGAVPATVPAKRRSIARAYKRHKLWSKLTPKNGSSAMPASAPTGRPSTASLRFAPPDAAAATSNREKATGARPDPRELNRMLGKLAPGDVMTVTRIDRLARSTFDLFGIVKRVVAAKAQFRSLAEPWADTGTGAGRASGGTRRLGRC